MSKYLPSYGALEAKYATQITASAQRGASITTDRESAQELAYDNVFTLLISADDFEAVPATVISDIAWAAAIAAADKI